MAFSVPTLPAFGTLPGTSHKISIEGILRMITFWCHAIIVAFTTYIYSFAPIIRVESAMLLAFIDMIGSLQVFPMRLFAEDYNFAMKVWVFCSDACIFGFLMYIGIAVSTAVSLLDPLHLLSTHRWNCLVTAMILIWITLFFQLILLLDITLRLFKKSDAPQSSYPANPQFKEGVEQSA